jgi:transcription factor TFIIIB component B''
LHRAMATLRQACLDPLTGTAQPEAPTRNQAEEQTEQVTANNSNNNNRHKDVAVRVVDGKIVIDEASLLFNKTNNEEAHSPRKASKRTRAKSKWTQEQTIRFFEAIQKYGLDFTLLGQLFPEFSRRELLLKYKREERKDPQKIDFLLMNKLPVDEEEFKESFEQAEQIEQNKKLAEQSIRDSVQVPTTKKKKLNKE